MQGADTITLSTPRRWANYPFEWHNRLAKIGAVITMDISGADMLEALVD
jgi:hypothetical protein